VVVGVVVAQETLQVVLVVALEAVRQIIQVVLLMGLARQVKETMVALV
jgi:hypothetical protein